jgi:two-component system, chemotaxis family, response regulator Rcp1
VNSILPYQRFKIMTEKLLIVDDNEADIDLLEEAIKEVGNGWEIHRASSGKEALSLIKEGLTPTLIILDLNMPNMSGMEVLDNIRQQGLRIPIIVYSTSASKIDINKAYDLYASCYVIKPDGDNIMKKLTCMVGFWLHLACHPGSEEINI